MKVLYLSNGLPHYFNPVLSAINRMPGVELIAIVPKTKSQFIGDGVYQTREDANFRIIELQEYVIGRPFASFKGLPAVLYREKPDVVVIPEHLLLAFHLHPMLWLLRRILRFGLVLKSIPFTVPYYSEALRETSRSDQARSMNAIAGQKAVPTKSKKDISNFKLRAGTAIGVRVTLRGDRMYEFLDRLISVALPRVRDFKGVNDKSFDGRGNYTLGVTEHIIFPEIDIDKITKINGMDITFVTSTTDNNEAKALLTELGIPFKKDN